MASQIKIDRELLIKQPSRLICTVAPGSLVRIGPDLEQAHDYLVSNLIDAYHSEGYNARHFATTYCLVNITIVIDCFESGEEVKLQLVRFCTRGNQIFVSTWEDDGLKQRISDQIRSIQKLQPNISLPFRCLEDWRGYGPREGDIYQRMLCASISQDKWLEFRHSVCTTLSPSVKSY